MIRVVGLVVIVLLVIIVQYSNGIKWIALKSGDHIPSNAISLNDVSKEFIGRARHYDEVLPARVNSTFAVIESCGKTIAKAEYEILVSRGNCRWHTFSQFENIPETIVRGGTAPNGEPIYIGTSTRSPYNMNNRRHPESIYLTSKSKNTWNVNNALSMLVCDDNSNWIDTAARNIPNRTVYGGVSEDGDQIYVARLKSGCSIIPGQATPALNVASAEYKHEKFHSAYCQVLVGDTDEYSWVMGYDGNIPDYAVVSSKDKSGELMYVARINKTLSYVTAEIAIRLNATYEILVKNVE